VFEGPVKTTIVERRFLPKVNAFQVNKQTQIPQIPDKQINNLPPTLPYVWMTVGLPQNKGPRKEAVGAYIKCMIDSGCAKSSINRETYLFLMENFNDNNHNLTKVNLQILSCTNTASQIDGTITIRIFLTCEPENQHYDITCMVVENLTEDLIIGYDVLNSHIIQAFTKTHLIFELPDHSDVYKIQIDKDIMPTIPCVTQMNINNLNLRVPMLGYKLRTQYNAEQIYPYNKPILTTNISNNFMDTMTQEITKQETEKTQKEEIDKSMLLINKAKIETKDNAKERLEKLEHYQKVLKSRQQQEKLRNMSKEARDMLKHEERTELNSINHIFTEYEKRTNGKRAKRDENIEINELKLNISKTRLNTVIKALKSDIAMNDQEKDIELENFKNTGYFQPSITQFLEDTNGVTELGLEDTSPKTDEQFLGMFDVDHLPPSAKKLALQIFANNKAAFSLHKYDIGKTNRITMKIDLRPGAEPKMQKYIPIPCNVKEQAKEILDQLLEHDIIRECNEPSPYCSNILVIKKKDGKSIRLLFDGRLLNYDTTREQQITISKPEIMAHLTNRTHLTSLDFADAFFHIPLTKEAQPLTAFYAHTHGKRMCFTRAPQGLRNSPLFLKLLLDDIFGDMTDSVLFYADDLLVASDGTLQEHLLLLNRVLERLVEAGMKLRPQKLMIAKDHIEFLGMIFIKTM